jgi:hypothetical protein
VTYRVCNHEIRNSDETSARRTLACYEPAMQLLCSLVRAKLPHFNRDLDASVSEVEAIVTAERLRRTRQISLADFVNRLRRG